ncbi:MAG TPA: hypothetical protein VEB18_01365 [Candidatus Paceibacterota bacterium]|nr:hypothetical protein [Candidatus Paceibacterota bacterium]
MTFFLVYGGIAAVLTALSLSLSGRGLVRTVSYTILAFVLFGFWGWIALPTFAWNFHTNWLMLLAFGIYCAFALWLMHDSYSYSDDEAKPSFGAIVPIGAVGFSLFMLIVVGFFASDPLFNSGRYRALLGNDPVTSTFTEDVSPVDIRHMRQVDADLAYRLGNRVVEQVPSLGSRTHLGAMDIQLLNGCLNIAQHSGEQNRICFDNELVWVGPLTHDSIFRYWSYHSTPGYVIVSAEDQSRVFLVTGLWTIDQTESTDFAIRLLNDGGHLGDYLPRYLREHGYLSEGLADYKFEIDDRGRPYWVVSTFQRTIGFSGDVPSDVLVIDAQTGEIERYAPTEAPAWVDQIQPATMVHDLLFHWGKWVEGYWNTWGARRNIIRPGDYTTMVHGEDGRSYWFVSLQAAGSSQGMNGFALVDTRTRLVRRYMIPGADQASAASTALGTLSTQGVENSGYVASTPILYNVDGIPTYFVPLKGTDGLVKMYAFVNVQDYQIVGVGSSLDQAHRAYQSALTQRGARLGADATVQNERIEGVVRRALTVRDSNGDTIFLLIDGQAGREFFAASALSPELKWTEAGNRVVFTAQSGQALSAPILAFDNLDLDLVRQQQQ